MSPGKHASTDACLTVRVFAPWGCIWDAASLQNWLSQVRFLASLRLSSAGGQPASIRFVSSIGRAPPSKGGGWWFDSIARHGKTAALRKPRGSTSGVCRPQGRAWVVTRPYGFESRPSYPTAGWCSLVARRSHKPQVAGSNPAPATGLSLDGDVKTHSRGPPEPSAVGSQTSEQPTSVQEAGTGTCEPHAAQ